MLSDNGSFAGKVAFVTGAANGIGRAAAMAFASQGVAVVGVDLSEGGNQETARMIEEVGGRALALKGDVSREDDVTAALARRSRLMAALISLSTTRGLSSRSRRLPRSRQRNGTGLLISTFAACSCA